MVLHPFRVRGYTHGLWSGRCPGQRYLTPLGSTGTIVDFGTWSTKRADADNYIPRREAGDTTKAMWTPTEEFTT